MKKQKGFVLVVALAWLAWTGAIGYSVYNAEQHPEVSKAGRK